MICILQKIQGVLFFTTLEGCNYYKEEIKFGICQIIGEVKIEGIRYSVLSCLFTYGGIRLVVGVKSVSLVVQRRR